MFMREILIPYTLAGRIGTRQSSAITTACKVLLDYDADLRNLKKLQEQADEMMKTQTEIEAGLELLKSFPRAVSMGGPSSENS